jgi:hypothetical protein
MKIDMEHNGLKLRLKVLTARIRELRDNAGRAEGIEKVRAHGVIGRLEQRRQRLEARLVELKSEGSGFRQRLKGEVEKLAYDLSSAAEDLLVSIDASYRPGERQPETRDASHREAAGP